MKNKIIISIAFMGIFFISVAEAMAYIPSCGDDYCTTELTYQENNPLVNTYCPLDCGIVTNEDWCHEEYNLINVNDYSRCPTSSTCPSCSTSSCDTSRISNSDLNNWCSANGYSPNVSSGASSSDIKNYWWIFLIIGGIIGYYYKKR